MFFRNERNAITRSFDRLRLLAIDRADLWLAGGILVLSAATIPLWGRWAYATFDPALARADRLPVQRDDYLLTVAIAVGAVAAASGVGLNATLVAWLHALASQFVSAAIRLGVLGQREAMALLQSLEPVILDTVGRVETSTLDDLGSAAVISDILSARHENLGVRLFRS